MQSSNETTEPLSIKVHDKELSFSFNKTHIEIPRRSVTLSRRTKICRKVLQIKRRGISTRQFHVHASRHPLRSPGRQNHPPPPSPTRYSRTTMRTMRKRTTTTMRRTREQSPAVVAGVRLLDAHTIGRHTARDLRQWHTTGDAIGVHTPGARHFAG